MDVTNILNRKPKTQVALTQIGKERADGDKVDGSTPKGKVIIYLKEHGQSNLSEISEDTGISFWRVKDICNELASNQWRWIEWV